ncbi:TPA: hypothetical protein N0F65_012286 [Lagenidium giganteum]|uniref:DUF2423 domain-containing protein n=1 Tax=Lagenidium giganteum TaxID=4803 RepID=A0AAV2ZCF4_9STRA|nr:TPA: hypothetical protein N0F65_012286 [Lagenidium giganteum]
MAKSLRSKIKRKFRTELRKKVGVPHQIKQESKIQEQLKKAIESQSTGSSMLGLKKLMGTTNAPVAAKEDEMDVDDAVVASTAATEAALLNTEEAAALKKKKAVEKKKKAAVKRRKNKFVQLHQLRKKGV